VILRAIPMNMLLNWFLLVGDKFSENIQIIANEPSLAFFRIQEHIRNTVPQLVDNKVCLSISSSLYLLVCLLDLSGLGCIISNKVDVFCMIRNRGWGPPIQCTVRWELPDGHFPRDTGSGFLWLIFANVCLKSA